MFREKISLVFMFSWWITGRIWRLVYGLFFLFLFFCYYKYKEVFLGLGVILVRKMGKEDIF